MKKKLNPTITVVKANKNKSVMAVGVCHCN